MKGLAILAASLSLLAVAAGCGGGGGGGGDEGTPPPAQETPTSGVTAEATAEVEEEEAPDRSDVSFVDNLLAKEEAGEWTRGEGLVATLRLFVGELDAAQVLRHPDLLDDEGTGILEMAYEYLDDGPDAEAKAEITRLLDLLVFSNDQLKAMAGISPPTAAHPGQGSLSAARGPVEDCLTFFHGYDIEGVSQCLEFQSATIDGNLYRVFHPAPSLPAAGWTEDRYKLALQAMRETVKAYKDKKLGKIPSVNLVFSVMTSPVTEGPQLDPPVGAAAAAPVPGKPCGVVLFTKLTTYSPSNFKQVIAHELAHCFHEEKFPAQRRVKHEFRRWWGEGLAEYLSNVVYDKNNLEWKRLEKANLAEYELTSTLFDRAYTNFLFFQYLEDRIGINGIFDVIRGLPQRRDSGRAEQEARLASARQDMDEIFHDFVKAVTDEAVKDTGGGTVPYEMNEKNRPTVRITATATPLVHRDFKPFGVARRLLIVDEDKGASLDFRPKGQVTESARPSKDWTEWWSEVPSELPVPEKDCPKEIIVVVTTTGRDGSFDLDVPRLLDVSPGSVVGEWVVDNDSIKPRIKRRFPETNLDSISGEIRATFRDDGKVEVVYENFKEKGHSEGDSVLALTLGEPDLYTEHTITTDARGTTSYEVKDLPTGEGGQIKDYIDIGSFFEQSYLEGTETVEYYQASYELGFAGDPDAIPVDELQDTREEEPSGTDLFTSLTEYELGCQGNVLRLEPDEEDVILHRVGFAD